MSPCPSPDALGRLARAPDSATGFAEAEAHVESCPACQAALDRLADDSSAPGVRGPGRCPPPEAPPAIPGFVIERRLGRGGMGIVYQARQPRLGRRVAIKVVGGGPGLGAEDRRRWLREARAIGRVRHRNIVRIHDAGEQDGCLYLVLELIPGGSLAERVAGPVPPRAAAGLMATVAQAVEHLHRAGIVHLDLKPSNILLDGPPEGRWDEATPMVTDFGIARARDDAGAGPIGPGGTPSFMAPEQVGGDGPAIGPRSDVFALGANLYALLTGRPPFQGASAIETLDALRSREPAPPRALVPGVPRDLETIALTCLRKDPRRRYATAGALAEDLRRWLDGFPIRARPVSAIGRAGRWCRRRPAAASLLAATAIALPAVLAGLLSLRRHAEAERTRAEAALARAHRSDEARSVAVGELVGLVSTHLDSPQLLADERLDHSARAVLDLAAALRRDHDPASSRLVEVCGLERRLAQELRALGKFADARALLADALELLGRRRGEVEDPDVDLLYADSLMEVALVAGDEGRPDEQLAYLRRAEEALARPARGPRRLDAIASLDLARLRTASALGRLGRDGPRRALLESHAAMLEHLAEGAGADPGIALLAALARSEVDPDAARARVARAIGRFPADRPLPGAIAWRLAGWIASDNDPYPPGRGLAPGGGGRFDPEAHADAILRGLESRIAALGAGPALLPASAHSVANLAAALGAERRKAGLLDEARRISASLSAFAKALVRRDPSEPTFHVILSQAFEQESKNAWKANDHPAVAAGLREALGEASIALRLDPENLSARTKVGVLRDKLARLEPAPPAPR